MSKTATDPAEEFGVKLDKCFTDAIVKFSGGAFLGLTSSIIFLGRRKWPIIAGAGIGLGIAYANCGYEINPKKK